MYSDFFVKTAWNQRNGKLQFAPNKEKEKIQCGNLTFGIIIHHHGLQFHGNKSYLLTEYGNVVTQDFDANQANLENIPRVFLNAYTDEQMFDTDQFLWNLCVVVERQWGDNVRLNSGDRDNLIMEHVPIKVIYHETSDKVAMENFSKRILPKIVPCLLMPIPIEKFPVTIITAG